MMSSTPTRAAGVHSPPRRCEPPRAPNRRRRAPVRVPRRLSAFRARLAVADAADAKNTAVAATSAAADAGPPTAATAASNRVAQSDGRTSSRAHAYGHRGDTAPAGPGGSTKDARRGGGAHGAHAPTPRSDLYVPAGHRRHNAPENPGGHGLDETLPSPPTPPSPRDAPPVAARVPSGAVRLLETPTETSGRRSGHARWIRPPPPPPPPGAPPAPPAAATRPVGSTSSARVNASTVPPLPPPPPPEPSSSSRSSRSSSISRSTSVSPPSAPFAETRAPAPTIKPASGRVAVPRTTRPPPPPPYPPPAPAPPPLPTPDAAHGAAPSPYADPPPETVPLGAVGADGASAARLTPP